MLSMAIQSTLSFSPLPSQNLTVRPFQSISTKPESTTLHLFTSPYKRTRTLSIYQTSAAPETLIAETFTETVNSTPEPVATKENEKVVKQVERPRLVLKFVWMEKNIGLALDQVIPAHGTVPLSPYFFWPRKDAWEELKTTLESKPWISQKSMIILLNQATDIINLWQQSGGNLS